MPKKRRNYQLSMIDSKHIPSVLLTRGMMVVTRVSNGVITATSEVKKIERNIPGEETVCSKDGVHVNGNECYDSTAQVEILIPID
jgi:hypothetical protein